MSADGYIKAAHPPIEDIRQLISYRLARLAHISDRLGQNWMMSDYQLRVMDWRIIGTIYAEQPARFSDIVAALNSDKGQVSRAISALAKRGLLDISTDPRDRRGRLLRLTRQGQALYDRILPEVIERNDDMVQVLTQQEMEQLISILHKLQSDTERRLRAQEG